jgi:hypothetical protein
MIEVGVVVVRTLKVALVQADDLAPQIERSRRLCLLGRRLGGGGACGFVHLGGSSAAIRLEVRCPTPRLRKLTCCQAAEVTLNRMYCCDQWHQLVERYGCC